MFSTHQVVLIDNKTARIKLLQVIDNILRWKYNTVNG